MQRPPHLDRWGGIFFTPNKNAPT
jgi:hypothetical protein